MGSREIGKYASGELAIDESERLRLIGDIAIEMFDRAKLAAEGRTMPVPVLASLLSQLCERGDDWSMGGILHTSRMIALWLRQTNDKAVVSTVDASFINEAKQRTTAFFDELSGFGDTASLPYIWELAKHDLALLERFRPVSS